MSMWKQKATSGGGDGEFPKAPPGNHPARLVALLDLGEQENTFNGESKIQHRLYLAWELVGEPMPGFKERNFVVGIDMTFSLNEKAKLRQWIETWRGKKLGEGEEFDVTVLLGKPCLLTVTTNDKGYPKVAGVAAAPKGFNVPDPLHKPFLFGLDQVKPDGSVELPDWLPFLYGERLADVIKGRKNNVREKVTANPSVPVGDAAEPEGIPF